MILAPILNQHGLAGLLTAGFMAGWMLLALGAFRLGAFIRFVPYPVTTGFTTGIATVIATLQVKDLLGLQIAAMPDAYHEKLQALFAARGTFQPEELAIAALTFALLLLTPRVLPKVPAPLIAIVAAAAVAALVHRGFPSIEFTTIGSRFHTPVNGVDVPGIPRMLPTPALPWGPSWLPSLDLLRTLLPAAVAIAALGAIESLLSAVVSDGMTGARHDPNAELVGQGIGNILAPIFGGIAATGALARTATNVRSGAVSPVAAIVHSVVVLLTCFGLTVFLDMTYAVSIGFMLAAVLFMRRMAEITETRVILEGTRGGEQRVDVPKGVLLYQIDGPLFFGAAQKALEALHASHTETFDVLVLDLSRVPVIDATGLVALEEALVSTRKGGKEVVLAGPLPRPRALFERAGLLERPGVSVVDDGLDAALVRAAERVAAKNSTPPRVPRPVGPASRPGVG